MHPKFVGSCMYSLFDGDLFKGYVGCWALDNILLVNTADTPTSITDNFDPIESSNWLFFPGAVIKVRVMCK